MKTYVVPHRGTYNEYPKQKLEKYYLETLSDLELWLMF